VKLGNPRLAETARDAACAANRASADRRAADVQPMIAAIQASGAKTLQAVAAALNARGVATARGGKWYAATVRNVVRRNMAMSAFGGKADISSDCPPNHDL
jgi:hypothetical protein